MKTLTAIIFTALLMVLTISEGSSITDNTTKYDITMNSASAQTVPEEETGCTMCTTAVTECYRIIIPNEGPHIFYGTAEECPDPVESGQGGL